ncbi:uncharacterized protein LOC132294571 isoform X2 [Cornus florida]|uniref:uncharacterized protein LOC132294571 isoform X2 n=1 Tax=Cornus florida TaxID=4283 RepID=UPI00289D31A2|nr:uncharacterized protein LOC132294571 isoform X2 [Cornus florida]
MHMHFKSFGDDVERARRKPYRNVRPGDWQAICENFMTPTCQRNMETEEEPNMVTFYHRTHCREDGTWVTQHCQGLYDRMIQEVNQQENSDGVSNSSTQLTRNEIYIQIVGSTSSYVRGLGHGEMSIISLRGSREDVVEARRSADEANRRADEANQRAEEATHGLKRQIKGLRH